MIPPALPERLLALPLFGYGSLVNADTLRRKDVSVMEARLPGWERVWSHRIHHADPRTKELRYPLALSIRPRSSVTIWGVALCGLSQDEAATVRSRELYYDTVEVTLETRGARAEPWRPMQAYTYVSPEGWQGAAEVAAAAKYEIWRSYVHVVLKGFADFYQEPGLHHFMETTSGWHAPYLEDHPPRYPRRALVDIAASQEEKFNELVHTAIVRDRDAISRGSCPAGDTQPTVDR